MGALVALPYLGSEFTGKKVRIQKGAASTSPTFSWSGKKYCNTADADDIGKAFADFLAAAWSIVVTHSWDSHGRLVLDCVTTDTVALEWTHPDSTFSGPALGFKDDVDAAGVTVALGIQRIEAPWQGGRLWVPEVTIYSWPRPRRAVDGFSSRTGAVSSRSSTSWQVVRPLFGSEPAPKVYAAAASQWPELVEELCPGSATDDPNLSFEASIWEPWSDARQPCRLTPDASDTSTYHDVQLDPDNGGLEWLGNPDLVISPRDRDGDEAANLYRVGPLPWRTWVG